MECGKTRVISQYQTKYSLPQKVFDGQASLNNKQRELLGKRSKNYGPIFISNSAHICKSGADSSHWPNSGYFQALPRLQIEVHEHEEKDRQLLLLPEVDLFQLWCLCGNCYNGISWEES